MIARQLGMTHAELLARCSARELIWWKALHEIEHAEAQHRAEAQRKGVGGRRRAR